jgi:hypothetical protein
VTEYFVVIFDTICKATKVCVVRFSLAFVFFKCIFFSLGTADGGTVVKALCHKSEGRGFDSRWCHCSFSLT